MIEAAEERSTTDYIYVAGRTAIIELYIISVVPKVKIPLIFCIRILIIRYNF